MNNSTIKKFTHGGNVYQKSPFDEPWLDFSANINPLGLSEKVKDAIVKNINTIVHYPDPAAKALKEKIAANYGVDVKNIVLGNGAAEIFYLFFRALKPKNLLLPVPSFSEYEKAATAYGTEIFYFPLNSAENFWLDFSKLLSLAPKYDAVFLANPNNPTGNLLKKESIIKLLEAVPQTIVAVDESFLDFLTDDADYTVRHCVDKYKNLVVISSLTKFFAIPGLRLGFAVMAEDLALQFDLQKDDWNVNLLAQEAGVAALDDEIYKEKARTFVKNEKDWLASKIKEVSNGKIKVFPPSVNFILLDVANVFDAADLSDEQNASAVFAARLRGKNILVRDCTNYPCLGNSFVRVAVRRREENEKLLAALAEICQ